MRGQEIKAILKTPFNASDPSSDPKVYGTLITSPSPHMPAVVKMLGLDFVFIDTEHISLNRETVSHMCQEYRALNITPVVRIHTCDPTLATCVIDGGAIGVVAPYMETVESVQQLRGAVKYRPLKGGILQNFLHGKSKLEPAVEEFLKEQNKEKLLIVNIESRPAMENLDQILSVPDLDCILIGPHDLSINLGVPCQWKHPIFDNAVRDIIAKTRARNIGVGIHHSFGIDEEIEWVKAGANFVLHSSDIVAFRDQMNFDFQKIKTSVSPSQTKVNKISPNEEIAI